MAQLLLNYLTKVVNYQNLSLVSYVSYQKTLSVFPHKIIQFQMFEPGW